MKLAVGVDISSTGIRVAAVRGLDTEGYAAVARIGIAPLREGIVAGGRIRNHLLVAQALQRALEMAGVPKYGFVVGLGSTDIAVSRLALPAAITPDERLTTIRTMDRPLSPTLSLSDAVLSANAVRTDVTSDGRIMTTLVVTAARREAVEDLQKVMLIAGASPRAIDLSAAGLMRALVRTRADSLEIATIVDIGETTTTIATRQGPHLRSVRVLPIGGTILTRAIMAETNDTYEQALARRQHFALSGDLVELDADLISSYGTSAPTPAARASATLLDEAVDNATNQLVNAIAAAIENDATNFSNTLTQGVALSGLTSQMPGLRQRIAQRTGVSVQAGRPWARLEKTRYNLPYMKPGEDPLSPLLGLSTAIGLALWRPQP
jgi:Tfp pilus assembly PilM family ATPase